MLRKLPFGRGHLVVWLLGFMAAQVFAHEGAFPEKTLRQIFPDAENFAARKVTLTSKQVSELMAVEKVVDPEDREFTFYVAIGKDNSGRHRSLGAVLILHGFGPQGIIDMAVGYKADLTVRGIVITENKNDQRIGSPEFLKQIENKGPNNSLVVGRDIRFHGDPQAAEALIKAVKKGMLLLRLIMKT